MMNTSCWRRLGAPILRLTKSIWPKKRGFCSLNDKHASHDLNLSLINSVVKVRCLCSPPHDAAPWWVQKKEIMSSAFMIGDGKLLTNAHCVRHHLQVKVKRRSDNKEYTAKVLTEGHDCDLALLSVENKDFWEGVTPLCLGSLPFCGQNVIVVGYPLDGEDVCLTRGIVSKLEIMSYGLRGNDLLLIELDSAFNYGSGGAPVLNDQGEVIGIAFMRGGDHSEFSYLIPTLVINHFLTDYKKYGRYMGFPSLPLILQKLDNKALCKYLKLQLDQGVLVRGVDDYTDLKKMDAIISVDDVPIQSMKIAGKRYNVEYNLRHLISEKFVGDTVRLGIVRQGMNMTVSIMLEAQNFWVPYSISCRPSYLIVGGLVFTKLAYGSAVVMLQEVLDHPVNIGYDRNFVNNQVTTFNGTPICNLWDLTRHVDACKDKFLTFELKGSYMIILERERAMAALPEILKFYGVPGERSEDLW